MSDSWYYTQDGKTKIGPLTFAALQQHASSGALQPTHMVRQEGEGRWMQAKAVPGLFPITSAQPVVATPAQPSPPSAIPVQVMAQKSFTETIKGKSKEPWVKIMAQPKNIRYAILGGGAAGFILMTCLCCGIMGFIGGGNSGTRGTPQAANKQADFSMTADALLRQFVADVAAAEKKYKGKYLKVSGKVGSLTDAAGIPGGPHFDFSTRNPNPVSIMGVFDTEDKMKPFWKKKEATVIGKCDGALPGSIRGSFMVILRHCEEAVPGAASGSDDSETPRDADESTYEAGFQTGYSLGQDKVEAYKSYNAVTKKEFRPIFVKMYDTLDRNYRSARDTYGENNGSVQRLKGIAEGYRKALREGRLLP